jgi:sugar transferase (PEP-CTERM/EpsH1 system associated)
MDEILLLVHRIPYPPNKGDKIRSFHILQRLARRYRVHLGSFVDDPADWCHAGALKPYVDQLQLRPLRPRWAKLCGLTGLLTGDPLTVPYYRDRQMQAWVDRIVAERSLKGALVFSSGMAQYLASHPTVPAVVDFVDVDSAKWHSYGAARHGPAGWIYRREGRMLEAYEIAVARRAQTALFVTPDETALFSRIAQGVPIDLRTLENGVDRDYFSLDGEYPNPYPEGIEPLVFTGAMDYWPNVDAVVWFAREVFQPLFVRRPQARFYVVGSRPARAVQALAGQPGVAVTGTVADIRPYLAHCRAAVAPLRIARGVQNKVLEAMAMAKPVIASPQAMEGIGGDGGLEVAVAEAAGRWIEILEKLENLPTVAHRNRGMIEERYDWEVNLAMLDHLWDG